MPYSSRKPARRRVAKLLKNSWRDFKHGVRSALTGNAFWKSTFESELSLTPVELFSPAGGAAASTSVYGTAHARDVSDVEIVGAHDLRKPLSAHVPASYISTVQDALVSGLNSMVIAEDRHLCIPGEDHRLSWQPANFAKFLIEVKGRYFLKVRPSARKLKRLPRAVLITGRFSRNYFHFMVEALQNLLLAEQMSPGDRPPILIAAMTRQNRELLQMLAPGRDIVELAAHQWCRVGTLSIPVVGSYAPDRVEETSRSGFDMTYLPRIRSAVLSAIGVADGARKEEARKGWAAPAIIYLSRRNMSRNKFRDVTNSAEIEDYIRSIGGNVVFPEKLTVAEQIRLFHSADCIVAAAGATLANLLFCRPGAVCICLHLDRLVNPWYFSDFARQAGVRWISVVGPAGGDAKPDDPHARFSIPLDGLRSAMQLAAAGSRPAT